MKITIKTKTMITYVIEIKHGTSRVVFGDKEYNVKTSWLKSLRVNDLTQLLLDDKL